jgi:hypothetical protein
MAPSEFVPVINEGTGTYKSKSLFIKKHYQKNLQIIIL